MNVTVQANLRRKVYYLALLTRHITCEARRFAFISLMGYTFSVNKLYSSRTSTNDHLSYNGQSTHLLLFHNGHLSTRRQRPLTHVPNCQNNLSTTASFFQRLMKKSWMVTNWHVYDQSIAVIVFWFCFIYTAAVSKICLRYLKLMLRILLVFLRYKHLWFKT